jgi:exodeoxyribonuclease V beta subunit
MGLAHLSAGVSVADVGRVLVDRLSDDDPLCDYARELVGPAFAGVPLAGLINGSIDAVLRVPVDGAPRLFITDYKSNRLGNVGDATHISAYAPSQLTQAMVEHHYPLQALIYGVALHRFLRWRAPDLDSDDVIGGVAYFFLRGMTADSAFVENGVPYGVFQWRAPRDLWAALSDAMSGRSEQ